MDFSDEKTLVHAIKDGNPASFRFFIDCYAPKLLSLLQNKYPLTMGDAEYIVNDAIEEVFMNKIKSFDHTKGKFFPWLARITINMAINHHKRRKSVKTVSLIYETHQLHQQLEVSSSNFTKHYIFHEAIETLPIKKDKEIIQLLLKNNLAISGVEAAKLLNIPHDTYRQRKKRALKHLKEHLASFKEFLYLYEE